MQPSTLIAQAAPRASGTPGSSPAALAAPYCAALQRELRHAAGPLTPDIALRAAARSCRALLLDRWAAAQPREHARIAAGEARRVHYLSMEFLMGRALGNALMALGLHGPVADSLRPLGIALQDVLEREPDAALGNGGLGRLAACFLDSFAELGLPSIGYGLRYQYGMFAQRIEGGQQTETPDDWLRHGNDWEVPRPELHYAVGFGGRVEVRGGQRRWVPAEVCTAQAYDFIVPAHGSEQVSTLRQWHACATETIDLQAFNAGEYLQAAQRITEVSALNWVLYPDDSTDAGRMLRLRQEAFLVSATLQDIVARHVAEQGDLATFGLRNAVHLNDTHPALAPAELMRLLLDEHGLPWERAWAITQQAVSYTNHTLMPEALETWPVAMFEALLPRHLEIVYEINRRFLAEVQARVPDDAAFAARVSLIDETGVRRVRMAALALVASHKVNGVSALHSDLMVQTIFADHARLSPQRFLNVTNGVTPRRWLMQANPALAAWLDSRLGTAWRRDLDQLGRLRALADDATACAELAGLKLHNKQRLAQHLRDTLQVDVDAQALFDVQIKRIHEYKRQLLNLLQVVARYQAIVDQPQRHWTPRVVVMAGKAASAYRAAKLIVRLAHDVAHVVNHDPRVAGRLKLVFVPNYGVSLAERIIPAADLSEQISTAGTEASGTGNMKFALNGALTIGTWDGANIEMAQAMGEDQLFVFGLRAHEVAHLKAQGYRPRDFLARSPALQAVVAALQSGAFSDGDPTRYTPLLSPLLDHDPYMLLADFDAYVQAQARVDALYAKPRDWAACALRNIAAMGRFSSDRTVAEYLQHVWAPATL